MGLRRRSEQVGKDHGEEQPGEKVRPMWMRLPVHLPRLSSPVLLIGSRLGAPRSPRIPWCLARLPREGSEGHKD